MKGALYPLVSVLQISEGIFSFLSFSPELAVISTGFVASALLAIIYLGPFAIVACYLSKYRPSRTLVHAITIIWLVSITAMGIAELTRSPELMMTATGTFVLATICSTLIIALYPAPRLINFMRKIH